MWLEWYDTEIYFEGFSIVYKEWFLFSSWNLFFLGSLLNVCENNTPQKLIKAFVNL